MALIAVLGLALGPTVSRLLLPSAAALEQTSATPTSAPGQHDQPTTESGTTDSLHHHHHQLARGLGSAPPAGNRPAHDHALEHCGLCLVAAHAFTFTQELPELLVFLEPAQRVTGAIALRLPRLRSDWSPASSRGPPTPG